MFRRRILFFPLLKLNRVVSVSKRQMFVITKNQKSVIIKVVTTVSSILIRAMVFMCSEPVEMNVRMKFILTEVAVLIWGSVIGTVHGNGTYSCNSLTK